MVHCGNGESIMEWQSLDEEPVLVFSVRPDPKYFFDEFWIELILIFEKELNGTFAGD